MPDETVIRIINLILAPVVMITACGIMLNGLVVRYNWLSDRIRQVHQERLNLIEANLTEFKDRLERLYLLDHLLPKLLNHHHHIHDGLVLFYAAILVFMVDMLVIALAISTHHSWLATGVIGVFLLGVGVLLCGIVLIAHELRTSHDFVQYEAHHHCPLCQKNTYPHRTHT